MEISSIADVLQIVGAAGTAITVVVWLIWPSLWKQFRAWLWGIPKRVSAWASAKWASVRAAALSCREFCADAHFLIRNRRALVELLKNPAPATVPVPTAAPVATITLSAPQKQTVSKERLEELEAEAAKLFAVKSYPSPPTPVFTTGPTVGAWSAKPTAGQSSAKPTLGEVAAKLTLGGQAARFALSEVASKVTRDLVTTKMGFDEVAAKLGLDAPSLYSREPEIFIYSQRPMTTEEMLEAIN